MASAIPVPGAPLSGDGSVLPYAVAPGPPRRGPLAGSVDTVALAAESVTADKLDPSVLRRRMRTAACSLGGASSTAGAFASVTWDPSQDTSGTIICASTVAPTVSVQLFGNASAGSFNVRVNELGAIQFRESITQRAISANGVYKFDGLPHAIGWRVTGTTVALTYDGSEVASGTFASVTWASAAQFIGAGTTTGAQRWPGSIQLVELTDLATPSNSRRYLLDEGVDVASYADSSGNGGAAATKNTGAGFPWVCAVLSHDGTGRPWTGAGPLYYMATRNGATTGITGSTTFSPTTSVTEIDPTGSLSAAQFTAPFACIARASFIGSVRATTLAGTDELTATIRPGGGASGDLPMQSLYLDATNKPCAFAPQGIWTLPAGGTLLARLESLVAGDVYTLDGGWQFVVEFTPTAPTL